jgi:hypothetical protein
VLIGPYMKTAFLVVYDYGTGGVWAVIHARSKGEIAQKYPMLIVQEDHPPWMTEKKYREIASSNTLDIDDQPTGWLLAAVNAK